jgi:hypothetical protein
VRRLLLLALPLLVLPAAVRAELSDDVQKVRNEFEFGRFDNALALAEDLIKNKSLFSVEDRIEANRIAGLARLYKQPSTETDRSRAEVYFLALLRIDPDYQLDPFFTPPAAVAFFDKVRKEHDAELGPLRDAIRKRHEEEARRAAEQAAIASAPRVIKYSKRTLAVVFLPLGAGQFQNDQPALGAAFAGVQVAAAVTALGAGLAYYSLEQPKVPIADAGRALAYQRTQYTAIGVGIATWIASSLQAWSVFKPEVELTPSGTLSGGAPTRLSPVVSPLAGGGLLGLQMGF